MKSVIKLQKSIMNIYEYNITLNILTLESEILAKWHFIEIIFPIFKCQMAIKLRHQYQLDRPDVLHPFPVVGSLRDHPKINPGVL